MRHIRIIGLGRAGGSFATALAAVGVKVSVLHHGDDLSKAALDVDAVLIATPDAAVALVADAITPVATTPVLHVAGSLGIDALLPHPRRGSLHPLVSLPSAIIGAARLPGAWMATAGDPGASTVGGLLNARLFPVSDDDRAIYHATAAIAANHLTALLGQVQRLSELVDVPFAAFTELARGALCNAAELGPKNALTGPVSRGDWATVRAHLAVLPAAERQLYLELAQAAARLVDQAWPRELA